MMWGGAVNVIFLCHSCPIICINSTSIIVTLAFFPQFLLTLSFQPSGLYYPITREAALGSEGLPTAYKFGLTFQFQSYAATGDFLLDTTGARRTTEIFSSYATSVNNLCNNCNQCIQQNNSGKMPKIFEKKILSSYRKKNGYHEYMT